MTLDEDGFSIALPGDYSVVKPRAFLYLLSRQSELGEKAAEVLRHQLKFTAIRPGRKTILIMVAKGDIAISLEDALAEEEKRNEETGVGWLLPAPRLASLPAGQAVVTVRPTLNGLVGRQFRFPRGDGEWTLLIAVRPADEEALLPTIDTLARGLRISDP